MENCKQTDLHQHFEKKKLIHKNKEQIMIPIDDLKKNKNVQSTKLLMYCTCHKCGTDNPLDENVFTLLLKMFDQLSFALP